MDQLKGANVSLGQFAAFNECVVTTKLKAAGFTVGATELLSATLYRFIKENAKKE